MDSTIDINLFQKRLAQTIAWCSSRVGRGEIATSLRSHSLRPPGWGVASQLNLPWDKIVTAIAEERGSRLRSDELATDITEGRLLISTSIIDSVADGASEVESEGFLDGEDLPPWDTWLCYLPGDPSDTEYPNGYLVSWVPPEFIELVQLGIEVNCVDCLRWAEDEDTAFTRQLRSAGLLS